MAKSNGAKKISLFGSAARGEEREDSDIDFLVEFEEDKSL
ncbi:nucleotidyltransferase family protein [Paenibacillus antibioticophila]|nr:nucleotidyltransferase domain-containing protein [Paenibacillus antibioticophila]